MNKQEIKSIALSFCSKIKYKLKVIDLNDRSLYGEILIELRGLGLDKKTIGYIKLDKICTQLVSKFEECDAFVDFAYSKKPEAEEKFDRYLTPDVVFDIINNILNED